LACRSGCPTQDHASWGDCARSAGFQLGDLGTGRKAHVDKRLNTYAKARSLGLQPEGTKLSQSQGLLQAVGA
jgi:hypothetical protein